MELDVFPIYWASAFNCLVYTHCKVIGCVFKHAHFCVQTNPMKHSPELCLPYDITEIVLKGIFFLGTKAFNACFILYMWIRKSCFLRKVAYCKLVWLWAIPVVFLSCLLLSLIPSLILLMMLVYFSLFYEVWLMPSIALLKWSLADLAWRWSSCAV